MEQEWRYAERSACRLVQQPRATQRYEARIDYEERRIRQRLYELAKKHPGSGYRRMTRLLRREGMAINKKRVQRLWREEGLRNPQRKRRKRARGHSENSCAMKKAEYQNHVWSWDFTMDETADGRRLKWFSVLEEADKFASALTVERPYSLPGILLGTSAFTAAGWGGSFYPPGMQSRDFLSYYATQFETVEVDSTFYGSPSARTVNNWAARTPEGFIFSVKVPQVITNEKGLVDCDSEFEEFVKTMDILGPKLGPMVFQFPLFDRWKYTKQDSFLAVLTPFLKKLPADHNFVIEIRNKNWLDARFADALREYNVALALTDTSFVPRPWEMKEKFDLITADFTYVRWLGDRKGIEEQTTTWDKAIVDRREDLTNWVELFRQFVSRNLKIFAYANNHYAGHGHATVKLFMDLWNQKK